MVKESSIKKLSIALAMVVGLAVVDMASDMAGLELGIVSSAAAQQAKKTRRLPGLSETQMKKLGVVQALVAPDTEENPSAKPNLPQALKELKKMERACRGKCNDYEIAQIYRFFAFVYYSQDKYREAIDAYKSIVSKSPNIPIAVELDSLNALAQLSFSLDRFDDALKHLKAWIDLSTVVGADKYFLWGTICYSKGDKKCALRETSRAIKKVEDSGKKAKEQWYGLQLALFLEKEDYKSSKSIIEKLIVSYPHAKYWTQYANINGLLDQESKQLSSYDAALVMKGVDRSQDFVNAAYLYLGADSPYKAAKILEQGMKEKKVTRNVKYLSVMAGAYRSAKEFDDAAKILNEAAVVAKKEDASNKDKKNYAYKEGNIYADLVTVYGLLDNHKAAISAGKKALQAGKITRACEVHFNMGTSYVDLGQFGSAIKSLEKAREDKQCRAIVSSWLTYAKREKERKEQLSKS